MKESGKEYCNTYNVPLLRLAKHFGRPIMRRKLPKVDVPKKTKLSHRFSLPCTRIAQAILAAKVTKGGRSQENKAFAVYPLGAFAGSIGEDFWNTMRHIWFVPLMLSVPAVPITSPKTR